MSHPSFLKKFAILEAKKKGFDVMEEITYAAVQKIITKRPQKSHKGTFGRVLIIGGNKYMGGAAIMASQAAVYAGAGLVTCASSKRNRSALHARLPEAMFLDYHDSKALLKAINTSDAIVLGPGLGESAWAKKLIQLTFENVPTSANLIVDGSALTLVAQNKDLKLSLPACHLIFTPHEMEWQRLSQIAINQQKPAQNLKVAQKLQATVVLKKHGTEIYHPSGRVAKLTIGGPHMATGGMGDTLTGICAAFLAQFKDKDPELVLEAAVFSHSQVADELAQSRYVVLPSQIAFEMPRYMHRVQA